MGEGEVDFDGIFETLRDMDFANKQLKPDAPKVGGDNIICVSYFGFPEKMEQQAPEALERIKPLGYTADASNANSFSYEETVVVFDTPDQRVYAEELIDALGCGRAVQNTDGEYVYDGDFLILIGSDWH